MIEQNENCTNLSSSVNFCTFLVMYFCVQLKFGFQISEKKIEVMIPSSKTEHTPKSYVKIKMRKNQSKDEKWIYRYVCVENGTFFD
jgi:hypothetical protein